MNKFFVSLFCAYAIFCFTYAAESKPIPVIFDTDMGNDVDDALALCMLFTAEDMGLCKILCIAHNKDNLNSAVATDIDSARYVFDNCPVPMYFSGFEFGDSVRYPRSEIDAYFGEGNPVFDAYNASSLKVHGRNGKFDWATFDMTSVLFVLEPKRIKLSAPGKVSVIDDSGRVGFMPAKGGLHKYFLLPEDTDKIKDRLVFFARARKL